AITVVRLIAAAVVIGKWNPRLRKGTRKMPPPRPSSAPSAPAAAPATKMIKVSAGVTAGTDRALARRRRIDREPPRLREVAGRSLDRARLGGLARRTVGAREARAGVLVVDRTVIDVAEPVALDLHRPAGQLRAARRLIFGRHATSRSARRPGC